MNKVLLLSFLGFFLGSCSDKRSDKSDGPQRTSFKLTELSTFAKTDWDKRCSSLGTFMKTFATDYFDQETKLTISDECYELVASEINYRQYFVLESRSAEISFNINVIADYDNIIVDINVKDQMNFSEDDFSSFPGLKNLQSELENWIGDSSESLKVKILGYTPEEFQVLMLGEINESKELFDNPKIVVTRGEESREKLFSGKIEIDELDDQVFGENGFLGCTDIICITNSELTYQFIGHYLKIIRSVTKESGVEREYLVTFKARSIDENDLSMELL